MSQSYPSLVQFVGGPFDGFEHGVSFPPEELAETVTLPVNPNVVRMLEGDSREARTAATSIAVYELGYREGNWRYEFVKAAPAQELQCEGWQF